MTVTRPSWYQTKVSKIVLCVDDSATMQMVADITFRGTEFTYVGARSYDEGIAKAKQGKPAIVLVDATIGGAGKSGYDLCLALKSEGSTADVPVVLLIGNAAPYDAGKGSSVGADANLPKPWDTQTMLEKVGEIVSKGASAKPAVGGGTAMSAAKPATPATAAKAPALPLDNQPPRSATIMGMPTIKMPGGPGAPPMGNAPVVNKTTMMAVPTMSPSGNMVAPASNAPAMRQPAPPAPAVVAAAPAVQSASSVGAPMSRSPMVAGTPTKRSALVERTLAKMAAKLAEASGLEPGSPELLALLKLSTEVVERIVWEVVPELAEAIIRENLADLTARRS